MLIRVPTFDVAGQQKDRAGTAYRSARLGPITIGEVMYLRDYTLDCDDVGSGYYVQVPVTGQFTARYRGIELSVGRDLAIVCRPEGGSFEGRWPANCRALCVRFDPVSVNAAMVLGDQKPAFDPVLNMADGYGRMWLDLLLSVNRQLWLPDGLLSQPLVAAPLADSLLNGFLLSMTRVDSAPASPAAVRTAIDLIETDPQAPLTVSALAAQCDVSVRTLQNGFRHHLGMSPMAYVRETRLRRAHEELRVADPFTETVAAVARRWGFGHLGRFAAAHEVRFGQTPSQTLRFAG
jgi:AraC-like DNA-binding protein